MAYNREQKHTMKKRAKKLRVRIAQRPYLMSLGLTAGATGVF